MAYTQQILEALSQWQSLRFRDIEIPFQDAVSSLSSDDPLVIAKPVGTTSTRWMMHRTNSEKVAIFCHAGVWAWNSPLDTGNYVPEGQSAPEGVPEGRIQSQPSYKCELAYAFDTSVDDSFWKHLRAFEDHARRQPNFNKGVRKRRAWQSGVDPTTRGKYIIGAKLFAKRTPLNSRDATTADGQEYLVPYEIHPWIMEGLRNYPELHQVPNPNRPMYYDLLDGVLRKLQDTNEPVFQKNDIVRVVFSVAFIIGGINWYPEIIPIEFTRVGKLPPYMTATTDLSSFPSISADYSPLEIGMPVTFINLPVTCKKRKASEEPLQGDPHIDKKPTPNRESTDPTYPATSGKPDAVMTEVNAKDEHEATDTDTVMADVGATDSSATESVDIPSTDDNVSIDAADDPVQGNATKQPDAVSAPRRPTQPSSSKKGKENKKPSN